MIKIKWGRTMLRETLKKYLDQFFYMWKTERNFLPMISYDEDKETLLYVGEENDDGDIQWEYRPADRTVDFSEIERKFSIMIPQEVKEYFNSYWFLQLEGFIGSDYIFMDPIDDTSDVILELEYFFTNESKEMIPIGTHGKWDVPICVKISTGEVVIWDEENGKEYVLAKSLEDLFCKMTVKREL